jgi:hypothetical protein
VKFCCFNFRRFRSCGWSLAGVADRSGDAEAPLAAFRRRGILGQAEPQTGNEAAGRPPPAGYAATAKAGHSGVLPWRGERDLGGACQACALWPCLPFDAFRILATIQVTREQFESAKVEHDCALKAIL